MNQFQLHLTKVLIELLSSTDLGDVAISIVKGPNEVTAELKLLSRDVAFWVYEDGASILGRDIDVRFEAEGYESESALMAAFVEHVKITLSSS